MTDPVKPVKPIACYAVYAVMQPTNAGVGIWIANFEEAEPAGQLAGDLVGFKLCRAVRITEEDPGRQSNRDVAMAEIVKDALSFRKL